MHEPIQTNKLSQIWVVLTAVILVLASCQKSPEAKVIPANPENLPAAQATSTNEPPSPTVSAATVYPPTTEAEAGSASATPQPGEITSTPSPAALTATAPTGKVILPILLYHRVNDRDKVGRYIVTVENFRKQMELLKQEGYESVTISQVASAIRSGEALPAKPIAITFDDGYLDVYENAYPILKELGYTATAYIITGTLGTELSYGYMQADQLKELSAAGWEIGSHSVTHTDLKKTKLGAGNEMKQSKQALEELLGIQVQSFSFPYASSNSSLKDLAAQTGYHSAVGIDVYNTHTEKQLYFLSRREVDRAMKLSGFKRLLEPSKVDNVMATQSAAATPAP